MGHFNDQLKTGHWNFGPGGSSDALGSSWYTYVFDLLDPNLPRPKFQTGTGGTWLKPAWQEDFIPGESGCFCNPTGGKFPGLDKASCPAQDKTTCTNGCCIDLVKEENGKGERGEKESLDGKEKYKGEEDGKRGRRNPQKASTQWVRQ